MLKLILLILICYSKLLRNVVNYIPIKITERVEREIVRVCLSQRNRQWQAPQEEPQTGTRAIKRYAIKWCFKLSIDNLFPYMRLLRIEYIKKPGKNRRRQRYEKRRSCRKSLPPTAASAALRAERLLGSLLTIYCDIHIKFECRKPYDTLSARRIMM